MGSILEFQNITYYYETKGKRELILDDVNYSFEKEMMYAIVGPSGSGKTTTLAIAGALEEQRNGKVLFNNQDLRDIGYTNYRNSKIGMVFQSYNLLDYLSPIQNVIAAIEIKMKYCQNKRDHAYDLLLRMGLSPDQMYRHVNKLSGGEQQRVAIARAIATNPEIILADEPTGNLDEKTSINIINIFKELAHIDKKCVIVVTHSHTFAEQADSIIKLENKKLNQLIEWNEDKIV